MRQTEVLGNHTLSGRNIAGAPLADPGYAGRQQRIYNGMPDDNPCFQSQ